MRTLPTDACNTFIPRVGTTESFIRPLSISTMLTPSCRPPCGVRRVTEKGWSVFHTELLAGDLPVLRSFIAIEQDVIPGHGVGGGQPAKDNEEFERGHGEAFSGVVAFFIALMKRFSKLKSPRSSLPKSD